MKRKLTLFLAAALLLTAAGCSGSSSGPEEKKLETVDVVLDWYPNAVHAFVYQAMDKGYFADEGLQVNILFPSNASDPLTMPAAGKADIGFYYQEDTIIAKANENVPVKVLGSVVQQPISIVAALKEKGITTPADLVGKTIGYSGTKFAEVAVAELLKGAGATLDDVTMIDVGFDLMSSMTTGNVDATIGCLVNHEVPQMEEEGFSVNWFDLDDYGVPTYYEGIFLASDETIANDSETLQAFLRASAKGFADMKADPEAALATLLANQNAENFPLSETVERKSMGVLIPMMETADAAFLSQSDACWQENIDWMLEQGLIDAAVPLDDVRVNLTF